jgi:uncharacterized protein YjbI with pentapeptide repeats
MANMTREDDGTVAKSTAAFATKAKDLESLHAAVVEATTAGTGVWVSYFLALFYLAIAAGGVTHRDLLLENPLKLPLLNLDLPLKSFFVFAPGLFLILHACVLLRFVLVAGKVRAFNGELRKQVFSGELRALLRFQLPSNMLVQFLSMPREMYNGITRLLLRLITGISLVAAPLALLIFFQLQFLPYHNEAIAWWQRLTVVADLALLWTLWPPIAGSERVRITWIDFRRGIVAAAIVASLVPILLVFGVLTFPGEWLDANLPSIRFLPSKSRPGGWTSLYALLVAGDIDLQTRKPTSVWSNRLVVPNIRPGDTAKPGASTDIRGLSERLSLSGRRLEKAILFSADLRKVDFSAAHLKDADLSGADLREATFGCDSFASQPECTDLRAASLEGAQLQGASFTGARLQGASLEGAQLQGASLAAARLQGASLAGAQLQGASLLQAQLQGASLLGAQLQGASLPQAQLQGALLVTAQLQGASLKGAQLQAASLDYAQLQGAELTGAQLQGASLLHVFVWRTESQGIETEGARIVAPETEPKYRSLDCPIEQQAPCDWSVGAFDVLRRLIEEQIPEGGHRDAALERIEILEPSKPAGGGERASWADLARSSPSAEMFDKRLVQLLRKAGCDTSGAPYVIRELARDLVVRFSSEGTQLAALAAGFLDETNCPGARGLSEQDKLRLRELRDFRALRPASPSPKA